jgi:hypothetical protein
MLQGLGGAHSFCIHLHGSFTSDRVAILATCKITTNRKATTLGGAQDRLEDVRCQDSLIMENIKNKV